METSRDDFVIALRSAFLKKGTQQRFSLLSLIFFSIIFLILGSFNFKIINYVKIGITEIVYRSSFIISVPENLIKDSYLIIQNHNKLYKENENIKSDLEILKAKDFEDNTIDMPNKLELFARQSINNWDCFGNEVDDSIDLSEYCG